MFQENRFDLIIFDCDGVLVDSEPVANRILQECLAREGLEMSLTDVVSTFVGLSMASVTAKAEALLGRALPDDFIDQMQADTFREFEQSLQAVAGIEDVLRHLVSKDIPICVASSGGFDKMDVTLGLTGLKKYFDGHIFSATQVQRGKPYPDLYLYAAEQMNAEPAKCLVVEDSVPGVKGAVAAGMEVMAYSVRGEDRALQKSGGLVIDDMTKILDHIS